MIIIMAGMMGTGKSTYTQWLANEYSIIPQMETVVDNPYLEKFYNNPKKYAYQLQQFFLNDRIQALKEAVKSEHTVLDRSLLENEIFNYVYRDLGYLTEEEFQQCQQDMYQAFNEIIQESQQEVLLIYLDGKFETVLKRIAQRDTEYERLEEGSHHLDYYRRLHDTYKEWYQRYDFSKKVKIDIQEFDVIYRPHEVIDYIKEELS